jgi:mono/diheme cytochrome c family protein
MRYSPWRAASIAAWASIVMASGAMADEGPVALAAGDGLSVVESNCGGCHSLDYIPMNSPFLKAETWNAEVTKMRKAFGAPITDADAETIAKYLAQYYGVPVTQ